MTFPVYASDYDCDPDTIDFNQGDVLSSEVFSEIIDKINNTIVGMTQSEINTSWSCKTIVGTDSARGTENGYSVDANGFYTMTQTLTFTEINSTSSRVVIPNNLSNSTIPTDPNDCTVSIYQNRIDISSTTGEGSAGSCWNNKGNKEIFKKSSTCMILGQNSAWTVCNKTDIPPDAPLNLYVTLAAISGSTNKKASLIWEAGDSTQANYDVQRKNTVDGTFTSIATPTDTNYADTTVTWNNTYWYRVFAVNADGTSYGSNVKKITYSNTPPSINIPSTISINEGSTEVRNVSASDADGHTLTYSIASQAPGNDASTMSIDASDPFGTLTFNSAPDYENPGDYDSNNIYDITVSVSDGYDTVSQDLSVVVLNVCEINQTLLIDNGDGTYTETYVCD